jgi:hypothetical protein
MLAVCEPCVLLRPLASIGSEIDDPSIFATLSVLFTRSYYRSATWEDKRFDDLGRNDNANLTNASSRGKSSVANQRFGTQNFFCGLQENDAFATCEQQFPTSTEQLLPAEGHEMLSPCALNEREIARCRNPNDF